MRLMGFMGFIGFRVYIVPPATKKTTYSRYPGPYIEPDRAIWKHQYQIKRVST